MKLTLDDDPIFETLKRKSPKEQKIIYTDEEDFTDSFIDETEPQD